MKQTENTTYIGLDFFKMIAAFMVVMVHTQPGGEFGVVGWFLGKVIQVIGVPFFFCCSGFFLSKGLKESKFPWKQIKRLLVFYCIWTIIYLSLGSVPITNIGAFLSYFFISGTAYHLWYIPALIYSTILISLIRNNRVLIIIATLFFLLGVLGSSFYAVGIQIPFVKEIILDYSFFDKFRRIFCIGLPFTTLGYIIAQNRNAIEALVRERTAQLFGIAILLFLGEMLFVIFFKIERDVFISLFLLLLVTAFFLRGLFLPLKNPDNLKEKGYICRLISNCIYFVHPLIIFLLLSFNVQLFSKLPTLTCIVTFVISASIGYVIIKINNRYLNMLIQ